MGKLNLMIKGGMLYANKKIFCNCGGGSGGKNIPVGRYEVEERYAHAHGDVLAFARGLGWIGHLPGATLSLVEMMAGVGLFHQKLWLEDCSR
jgi:hypothetical protein